MATGLAFYNYELSMWSKEASQNSTYWRIEAAASRFPGAGIVSAGRSWGVIGDDDFIRFVDAELASARIFATKTYGYGTGHSLSEKECRDCFTGFNSTGGSRR